MSNVKIIATNSNSNVTGRNVAISDATGVRVRLDWPPRSPVPVLAGGEGPKTIALTGEVADGTVLTSGTSPAMVRTAVERITTARREAGRDGAHEVVVFLNAEFGEGAAERMEAEFDAWGFEGERRFAALGDEEAVAATVREIIDAGATTVLLQSRSAEPDLDGYVRAVARVQALLA